MSFFCSSTIYKSNSICSSTKARINFNSNLENCLILAKPNILEIIRINDLKLPSIEIEVFCNICEICTIVISTMEDWIFILTLENDIIIGKINENFVFERKWFNSNHKLRISNINPYINNKSYQYILKSTNILNMCLMYVKYRRFY